MKIKTPAWTYRQSFELCECKGGNCLLFVKCNVCGCVFLHCQEAGFIYKSVSHEMASDTDKCPKCGIVCDYNKNIKVCTSEQIQAMGYSKEQYSQIPA